MSTATVKQHYFMQREVRALFRQDVRRTPLSITTFCNVTSSTGKLLVCPSTTSDVRPDKHCQQPTDTQRRPQFIENLPKIVEHTDAKNKDVWP